MKLISYATFLLIGLIAGWFVYLRRQNRRARFGANLALGVFGATAGGILYGRLDAETLKVVGEFAASITGAIFLFVFAGFVRQTVKFVWNKNDTFNS